jgi:hypothetical protein
MKGEFVASKGAPRMATSARSRNKQIVSLLVRFFFVTAPDFRFVALTADQARL